MLKFFEFFKQESGEVNNSSILIYPVIFIIYFFIFDNKMMSLKIKCEQGFLVTIGLSLMLYGIRYLYVLTEKDFTNIKNTNFRSNFERLYVYKVNFIGFPNIYEVQKKDKAIEIHGISKKVKRQIKTSLTIYEQ